MFGADDGGERLDGWAPWSEKGKLKTKFKVRLGGKALSGMWRNAGVDKKQITYTRNENIKGPTLAKS